MLLDKWIQGNWSMRTGRPAAANSASASALCVLIAAAGNAGPKSPPLYPAGDLTDVPPDAIVSPIDRLTQAFPGSEIIEERT